jgi:hypothetical protein
MRRAVIVCTPDFLRAGLGVLVDAGLSVFGSYESSAQPEGVVVLGIEGEALPARCEPNLEPLLEVSVTLTQEAYGEQRLVRVTTISLTGRNVFDISPRPIDYTAGRRRAA